MELLRLEKISKMIDSDHLTQHCQVPTKPYP